MASGTDTTADFYRVLGVSHNATHEEIRAAYRGKLRLWHPDLVADKTEDGRRTATAMTAQLNEAYECLSDPDRRTAYDMSSRPGTSSATHRTTSHLVVSPRTLRCEVKPGDTVRLFLEVQADGSPGGESIQVYTTEHLLGANFMVTARAANRAKVTVQIDTTKLSAHRIYHIPITVTWGTLTGTATLEIRTTEPRDASFKPPPHRRSASSSPGRSTRLSGRRLRDLATISLGGVVLPLLVLAWASGFLPVPTPVNRPLVAAISAAVIAATTWILTSSRLFREPDRLAPIGVIWSHLMRWSGWILVGIGAVLLGIPAVILTVVAVTAIPLLGLVVIALFSDRSDSEVR